VIALSAKARRQNRRYQHEFLPVADKKLRIAAGISVVSMVSKREPKWTAGRTRMDTRLRFVEYLKNESPIALQLLEPAGRAVDQKCLFYHFMPRHRPNFEHLSQSPLVDSLARAATQIKLNIRIYKLDSNMRS
jgi:hypothetical protein